MRLDFTDHYTEVDNLCIHYWDEGSGPTVLLVHGVGVSVESWSPTIEGLSTKYRLIAFDIPGFGKSARSARRDIYSLKYSGWLIKSFVDKLGITQFALAGNSLGGILAIQLALTYPNIVKKLILVDSAGLGHEINPGASLVTIWPIGELVIHPTRPFVTFLAKSLLYNDELVTDEFVDRMLMISQIPGTKEAMLRILRTGVNITGQFQLFNKSELCKIAVPTMIVWGRQDKALPMSQAESALQAIPNARAVILDKAGHAPQLDRPETFNQLLSEFLDKDRLKIEEITSGKRPFNL
jgi:pimeloyl-ACP methyl ester carboxylesterase